MIWKRFLATKVIKTPQMGESITEGTLISWLKQVGQNISRDEQIATIETDKVYNIDKIDVAVNSPENGVLEELFFKEGDTVQVGGDLFRITVDNGIGGIVGQPSKPSTAPSSEGKANKLSHPNESSQSQTQKSIPTRAPLIKFLGPRKLLWEVQSSGNIDAKSPQSMPKKFEKSVVEIVPERFRRTNLSAVEIEAIDVIIFNLVWLLSVIKQYFESTSCLFHLIIKFQLPPK